ncbi:tumor necrosis factor receptor superfamily member 1A isoform X2 [Vanacampus margaritifer]
MAALGNLILLTCVLTPTLALIHTLEEKTCPDGDYAVDGFCCNKCSRGFKLLAKCSADGMRSDCTPCPEDQFMDQMNYSPNCMRCKPCKKLKHEVEVSKCERYRNTLCSCEDDYYTFTIDSETTECRKCTLCGSDEREVQKCSAERNTVCECKENYFRVNRKCEPCKSCTTECKHLCETLPSHKLADAPVGGSGSLVHILTAVVVVAVMLLMVLIVYIAIKRFTKKSPRKSALQTTETSPESSETLFQNEEVPIITVIDRPESTILCQATSNLPDCVPREIKTHDLIYSLLDSVPVTQVKQLVRSLGVSETVIERAELDHRASKEAHYQMLKAWAEGRSQASGGGGGGGGGGGRGGMLHLALLQELLLKLRHMHLGGVAEEMETKYSIH